MPGRLAVLATVALVLPVPTGASAGSSPSPVAADEPPAQAPLPRGPAMLVAPEAGGALLGAAPHPEVVPLLAVPVRAPLGRAVQVLPSGQVVAVERPLLLPPPGGRVLVRVVEQVERGPAAGIGPDGVMPAGGSGGSGGAGGSSGSGESPPPGSAPGAPSPVLTAAGRAAAGPLGFLRVLADILAALLDLLGRLGAPVLVLWHRVLGPKLLEHPLRRRVVEAATAEPGLHVRELARRLGAHPKTLAYHLMLLRRGRHVQLVREGRLLRVFPIAAPVIAPPPGTRERLVALLLEGASPRESLAAQLGVSPQAVSYHARALQREGRVAVRRRGRSVEYSLQPRPPPGP